MRTLHLFHIHPIILYPRKHLLLRVIIAEAELIRYARFQSEIIESLIMSPSKISSVIHSPSLADSFLRYCFSISNPLCYSSKDKLQLRLIFLMARAGQICPEWLQNCQFDPYLAMKICVISISWFFLILAHNMLFSNAEGQTDLSHLLSKHLRGVD